MAMGGGGSTYKSADGIWHAAIDIEPDRATGRRRRLTAQGKTKAVANARLRMKLDAYVRKGLTPNSPSPRLMDWLETWYHERAEANLRPNSRRSYENAIVRLNKCLSSNRGGRVRRLIWTLSAFRLDGAGGCWFPLFVGYFMSECVFR